MKTNKILLGVALALIVYLGISSFGFLSNIKGSGNVIKETRDVATFHAIEVGGAFEVFIEQGTPQSVIVESDDNIVPTIKTKVKNGELEISNDKSINNATTLKITIIVANLDDIDISGACNMKSANGFSSNEMDIEGSGASEIEMSIKSKKLNLDFSGAANGDFTGSTSTLGIEASGAADIDCENLIADVVAVDASGASSVSVTAEKIIKIDASGAANVNYKTDKASVDISTSGAASTKKK
jgi:hypothetical protein